MFTLLLSQLLMIISPAFHVDQAAFLGESKADPGIVERKSFLLLPIEALCVIFWILMSYSGHHLDTQTF